MSYKVEIILRKDPIVQLEGSKSSIEDLYNDLLNETKGFKYQITVKVLLKKYKHNEEICSGLFQFIHKNSDKSHIQIRKFFSRHFIHD